MDVSRKKVIIYNLFLCLALKSTTFHQLLNTFVDHFLKGDLASVTVLFLSQTDS